MAKHTTCRVEEERKQSLLAYLNCLQCELMLPYAGH